MANVKISALPADAAAATDEIAVNSGGITQKITASATAALNTDNSIGVSKSYGCCSSPSTLTSKVIALTISPSKVTSFF